MSGKILAIISAIYIIGFILGATYEGTWALEDSTVSGTLADGTGTANGAPITLVDGANTIDVTGLGTFTITLPSGGVVGTATSGVCTVTGSPVNLIAGDNTIVTTTLVGTITVTINRWISDDNQTAIATIDYLFNVRNAVQITTILGSIPFPTPNSQWFEAWFRATTFKWSFLDDYQLVWYVFLLPFAIIGVVTMVTLFIGILQGNITWS